MSEPKPSETKPKKMVSRNVAIALGIICIVLIAGMGEVVAYYTMQISNTETLLNQALTLAPSVAQGVYNGFQLTMTLEKTVYGLGNLVTVSLTLTNISNQTVTFALDLSFSYFQFFVYNSKMNMIYSSLNNGGVLLPLAFLNTLNAGQSMSDSNNWDPVLLGTYYIVGQVGPMNCLVTNSTIKTSPIQVKIV